MKTDCCFEYAYDKKGNKVGFMWGGVGFTSKFNVLTSFCNTKAGDVFVDCGSKYKVFNGDFKKIPYVHKKQFNKFLLKLEKEINKKLVRPDWFKEAIKELTKPKVTITSTPLGSNEFYKTWANSSHKNFYDVFIKVPPPIEYINFEFKVGKLEPKKYPPLTIIEHGTKNILYEGDEIDLGYSVVMIKNTPYRFINTEHVKDIDLKYDFKVVSVEKMKGLSE